MIVTNDFVQTYLDWAIFDPSYSNSLTLLAASVFDRGSSARTFCAKAQASGIASGIKCYIREFNQYGDEYQVAMGFTRATKEFGGYTASKPEVIFFDQDRVLRYQLIHDQLASGGKFLVTSCEESVRDADIYSYLMQRYDLPLKREWIPKIFQRLQEESVCKIYEKRTATQIGENDGGTFLVAAETLDREITVGNRKMCLADMILIRFDAAQEKMDKIVSDLVASGETPITTAEEDRKMLPIDISSMDNYFHEQHADLIQHVLDSLNVLSEGPGRVDTLACKAKTPYIEQGEAINGLVALFENGSKYGLALCDMGTGKTLMGISTVESFAVRKWLRSHPGKTVRDAYMTPDAIKYRIGVIAPGHMIEKWGAEILKVIPYAKVHQITSFAQVAKLKNEKPQGKEFYIFAKDFAKGNYMYGPIPTQIKTRPKVKYVCADCMDADIVVIQSDGEKKCPTCGGTHWVRQEEPVHYICADCEERKVRVVRGKGECCPACGGTHWKRDENDLQTGLICPHCGEMLMKRRDGEEIPMTDLDFLSMNASNRYCNHCGTPLWGAEAVTINANTSTSMSFDMPDANQGITPTKWKRMSFSNTYTNRTKAGVYVLPRYERQPDGTVEATINPEIWFLDAMKSVPKESAKLFDPAGTRKMSPAVWMKKHLNADFFDFLIMDEAHQYTNQSVQTHAAHCLIKISKHVLGLTGTLANGTAGNTFQLLWMLDPQKMRKKYKFDSRTEFVEEYGTMEESFYGDMNENHSVTDRGARIGQKREKPGISVSLNLDFFIEKSVTMSIKDFKAILPDFIEQVVSVKLGEGLDDEYRRMEGSYNALFSDRALAFKMGVMHRQHSLYWPDLPNHRDVTSPLNGRVLFELPDLTDELMSGGKLLPKEEKLVELVSSEISQNRNVVVYIQCTGKGEGRVTERIKEVLVSRGVLGESEISILETKVPPAKREQWIKDHACRGMRCLIVNPQLVETGLDFIFEENGVVYNYPTLIYYEIGDKLATMWQSSRRAYRLIQRETCRVFYLAYEQTQAVACLESIANKEYAASILQGQFSGGALAAMANIVDPKVRMAQALRNGDYGNVDKINAVFAKANYVDRTEVERIDPAPDFYTLTGLVDDLGLARDTDDDIFDADFVEFEEAEEAEKPAEEVPGEASTEEPEAAEPELAEETPEKPETLDSDDEDEFDNWDNWDSDDWFKSLSGSDNEDEDGVLVLEYKKSRRKKKFFF